MNTNATPQTFIKKNIRGNWEAQTQVPFDKDESGKERVIRLYTSKSSSGALYTSASVQTISDGFMSHMMYQDFSKTLEQTRDRCTAKAVEAQHARHVANVADIIAAAKQHYENKAE